MPPFRYKTFVDPYVGTIAELMGAGQRAEAQAAAQIAQIRAREAQQRGQAWGGAIESIGDIASTYMSPEAKKQREIDKGNEILTRRALEQQQFLRERVVPGHAVPEIVPPEQTEPTARMYRDALLQGDSLVGTSPVTKYGNALLGGDALVGTSPRPDQRPRIDPFKQQLSRELEGAFGTVREGRTPDDLQAYQSDPVGRYVTENGLYDVKRAYGDLIQAGISQPVANALAKQGLEANTIFAAADDIAEKFRRSQVEVRGTIAKMAISIHNADPDMTWEEALKSAQGPEKNRFSPQELEEFQVMFFRQSPEGKENILRGMVNAWDQQSDKTVIPAGAQQVGISGNVITQPSFRPTPTTAAEYDRGDYLKYVEGVPAGEKPLSFNAWESWQKTLGGELGRKARPFGAPYGRLNTETGEPELVERLDDGTERILGTPIPTAAGRGSRRLVYDRSNTAWLLDSNAEPGKELTRLTFEDGTPFPAKLPASLVSMSVGAKTIRAHIDPLREMAFKLEQMGLFGAVQGRIRDVYARIGTANFGGMDAYLNENDDSNQGRLRLQVQMEDISAEIEQDLISELSSTEAVENAIATYATDAEALVYEERAKNPDAAFERDRLIGQFASSLALMASGAGRVHGGARGGGSIAMIKYMKGLVSGVGSRGTFTGRMDSLDHWMGGYQGMMEIEQGLLDDELGLPPDLENGDGDSGTLAF
jgi:hypothetical protein